MAEQATDVQREVDEIADELYALTPDAFTAARDERVRQARAEKRADLAREIAKLRKPTQSAWLVNLLWRDQRAVLEQFFEVADALRSAQAQAAGDELRALTNQRRELERAMIRQAKALAAKAGVDISDSTEREAQETLSAALAQPEVADEVRTGRLTKSIEYAGFGTLPTGITPRAAAAPARPSPGSKQEPARVDDFAAKAAERAQRRRQEAEQRVEAARSALDDHLAALREHQRVLSDAQERQTGLGEELKSAEARVRDLRVQIETAADAVESATRRRDQAEKARRTAEQALEEAERALDDVAGSS